MNERALSSAVLYALWNSVDQYLPSAEHSNPVEKDSKTVTQAHLRNLLQARLKGELPDHFDQSYTGKSIRRLYATTATS